MMPDGKGAKLSNYDNFFKAFLTRVKKESPSIILEKINPESDMGIKRSERRILITEVSDQILDQVAKDIKIR